MNSDAVGPGMNVLIHDDLLATGGTAEAAAKLIKSVGGNVSSFWFLITLNELNGKEKLSQYCNNFFSSMEC